MTLNKMNVDKITEYITTVYKMSTCKIFADKWLERK